MKKILYILALLLATVACTLEEPAVREMIPDIDGDGPEGRVTIEFDVDAPIASPGTKALSEKPTDNENLYVAVFGSSGYLKEYVEATMLDTPSENNTYYRYQVTLAISENSKRILHFIANGPKPEEVPFDQMTSILPNMLSTAGTGAYWQTKTLTGIKARRNAAGYFIDKDSVVITNTATQQYVVSDETRDSLSNIHLIRNFSKIAIIDTVKNSNFTLKSFAAVNVPTAGSLAPYYSEGFVMGYQYLSYADLDTTLHYPGRLPASATFDATIPSETDFQNLTNGVVGRDSYVYLYERPAPNDRQKPTYVIMYGHYRNPDDLENEGDYYYKVDLMEGGRYYPLYRNFKYKIHVVKILKPGAETPEDAAASAGSGDVSGAQETQNLTDISDGQSRIAVDRMSETVVRQRTVDDPLLIKYKFYPDITDIPDGETEPRHNNDSTSHGGYITIEKENGSVIDSFTLDAADETDGYRVIRIATKTPSSAPLSEYLTITGTIDGRELYRKIKISMLSTQPLYVDCQTDKLLALPNQQQKVDVSIPGKILPESMFPLVFQIEAEALSLTPDNSVAGNNLPVASGSTIKPDASGPAFHFLKTLSYDEYMELPTSPNHDGCVYFTAHFLTNKEANASVVYVANTFFNTGSDSFSNYAMKHFLSGQFDGGVPMAMDQMVTLKFTLETLPEEGNVLPERVYITPRGLRVATSNNLIQEGSRYYFIPNSTVNTAGNLVCDAAGNTTIFLYTTTDDGDVSVKLEANEYYDETVTPYTPSFSELAFTSNTSGTVTNSLALGRNQGVYFRFRYEDGYSGSGFPVTFMMNGLTAADDETRLVDNGDGTFTFTPTNNNVTQYVHLKSTTRFSAVSVQIASGRYNAVSPVTLNRATSFTIPANTIYLRGSGNGAPSNFTARSTEWWGGESGTYVEIYPDASYGSYLDRSRYADYLNYNEQSVDATQLSLADDTKLYFRYASGTYTTTYYYATSTLDDVFSVIEGTSDRVTLHFRTRTTRTYTVTFASGNYQTRSFTDGTSGITLSFDNNTTGVVRNSSTYYKQMGNNNVNGSLTVSSENSTLDECVITTIAMTYRGNGYRNGTVTLSPNTGSYSRSQNTGTWTGSADVLTMTMGKDGNNYNQISSITITYSYLQ